MPQIRRGTFFGETQKALAAALHEAGQTDTEIALAIGVSVNNIAWWRNEVALPANGASQPSTPVLTPAPVAPSTSALMTPAQAQLAHAAPVQPSSDHALDIGLHMDAPAYVDLEELLATRLLIQGNSGSGKSHLLRRLLEASATRVQQIIIDPEGDFVSLAEAYGHMVVGAAEHLVGRMRSFAARAREHRASVVLNLDGLDLDGQMEAVTTFLGGLFDAPREQWTAALVVVDEAHLFAPSADNGANPDTRKACTQAIADLMSRGRKRGLAGIIATQRLAKLHKNVAAEASNFLMGRTFLDIDMSRAADLLGMEKRQAEQIRDLGRGEFLGLGPAISRRPLKVKIGAVQTAGKAGPAGGLAPMPTMSATQLADLMFAPEEEPGKPALRVVA